jgi:predicted ATPase with chaperone activity
MTTASQPSLEELFADSVKSTDVEHIELFRPARPATFEDAGIGSIFAESLVLKYLQANGSSTGRKIAEDLALPVKDFKSLMTYLKNEQMVYYKDSGQLDFTFALSDSGRDRAKKYVEECTYLGTAPVPLESYIESVHQQTIALEKPTRENLERAFNDLMLTDEMFNRLGPAVNSGRGLFLYGAPGNGKSSIAERITSCFGAEIWIPRSILVDGQIIMLFDPQVHEEIPLEPSLLKEKEYDERWIRVRRPTIVVGGELTMDALEICYDPISKISHAPLQLKSNCGSLVIDDFGRQRVNPFELLNRWIVPLEKRFDFLQLVTGTKLEVPFDQLIIFSTNLEPKDLVDDAFLRRIPYKIEVKDPAEAEIRDLLIVMADKGNVQIESEAVEHLINRYHVENRPFRYCHPRDLLDQIINYCRYENIDRVMTKPAVDFAMTNYFTVV